MKRIVYLLIFTSFLFSQNKRYIDFDEIDGPSFLLNSQKSFQSNFPPQLKKVKDPNISGGTISDVTQHWPLQNNVDAASVPFLGPLDMAEDANGNLYISSPDLHVIRKVDTNGKITTFAGTGGQACSGDGAVAITARFNSPHGLAFDASGNLYVADRNNHVVRKIDTNGIITTIAGTEYSGYNGDNISASINPTDRTTTNKNKTYFGAFEVI